jgi:2'-5' RNA ligase
MATDHFERHRVKAEGDKPWWNFNVVFDNQPDVVRMAQQYAPLLQHPGLYEPIPPQWLHSTILAVGTTHEFTELEMLAVADKLEPLLANLELPEFQFDSWWIWEGNVVLHISPEDEFTRIYDAVTEALTQTVGPKRTRKSPYGNFVPHTSLAYTRTHDKEHEIHRQLVEHPVVPAAFKVAYLPLIRQWPKNGHYEWEVVRKIPIGRSSP